MENGDLGPRVLGGSCPRVDRRTLGNLRQAPGIRASRWVARGSHLRARGPRSRSPESPLVPKLRHYQTVHGSPRSARAYTAQPFVGGEIPLLGIRWHGGKGADRRRAGPWPASPRRDRGPSGKSTGGCRASSASFSSYGGSGQQVLDHFQQLIAVDRLGDEPFRGRDVLSAAHELLEIFGPPTVARDRGDDHHRNGGQVA
jgi:hypothetical protein